MFRTNNNLFLFAGVIALAFGIGEAAHKTVFQLKKVMIINETGSGGYAHTTQINYTSNYYNTYLGPKYGFKCTIPATQAAIDAVMRDDSLATYDVVIFNGGTRVGGSGAVGDTGAQHAFQRWLKAGGGLVSIHGLLDHNDTWAWLRDSVLNGTKFTVHSNWGAGGKDATAQVQWDTLKTNGVLNSTKHEYDSIAACFPPLGNHFTYPDEWYSVSVNPRPFADVLMTIDEATYTVPATGTMGLGHPVMWAYKLPPDADGNIGRTIYTARGHDVGAWDGTSSNHAPTAPAPINGVVYSDTSHTLMTKGWLWQSLQWAAGLHLNNHTSIKFKATDASVNGILSAQKQNGVLKVQVNGTGKYEVNVYTLSGKNMGRRLGSGAAEYSFQGLKPATLYLVQVKSGKKAYAQRVML